MIKLKIKNYNTILTEKQEAGKIILPLKLSLKLINMTVLQVKKYYYPIKGE